MQRLKRSAGFINPWGNTALDIKNKDVIAKRKSLYTQLQQKLEGQDEKLKDQAGTIETLERQLVQAGIKNKVMQGSVEVNKKVEDSKSQVYKDELETKAMQKTLRNALQSDSKYKVRRSDDKQKDFEKNLELNNR